MQNAFFEKPFKYSVCRLFILYMMELEKEIISIPSSAEEFPLLVVIITVCILINSC